jgi:hypothetical protein
VQLAVSAGSGIGQEEQCIQNLVGKPEGKIQKYLCKWEDNIKMALKEMGYEFGLDSSF